MLFNFAIEFSQIASGQNITHPRSLPTRSGGTTPGAVPPSIRFEIRQLQIVNGVNQYVNVWGGVPAGNDLVAKMDFYSKWNKYSK